MPGVSDEAFEKMAEHVPDGARMWREYWSQLREHELQLMQRQQDLDYIRASAVGRPMPCWAASKGASGRYLPGCTNDECAEHDSLPAAVAVCEALGDNCGGVTAVVARGSYQTRAGATLRTGPADETSWVKRRCAKESTIGGDMGRASFMSVCELCISLATSVLDRLGKRRRSEMEVLELVDEWSASMSWRMEQRGRSRNNREAFDSLYEHAETLENELLGSAPDAQPTEICARTLPEACTKMELEAAKGDHDEAAAAKAAAAESATPKKNK